MLAYIAVARITDFFILLNSSRRSSVTYPIFKVIKQFIMLNLHHHKITFFGRKNGKLVLRILHSFTAYAVVFLTF